MKLSLLQKLIEWSIQLTVKYKLLPTYKYKVGDRVRYNWKAKKMIYSAIKHNVNDVLIIHEVKHSRNEFINYQNTRTKKRGSTDAYWLKRADNCNRPEVKSKDYRNRLKVLEQRAKEETTKFE